MNRHIRNITFGLVIGAAAAAVSVAVVGNSNSLEPGDTERPTPIPTAVATQTPAVVPTETSPSVVLFDPFQEGTPVPLNPIPQCGLRVDADFASSVEKLYDISHIAVLARAERVIEAVSMSGQPNDQSKHLNLARVYELKVIEYLKRTGPGTIEFQQWEGFFRKSDLSDDVLADISLFESQVNCFNPLEIGQEYVLFLRPLSYQLTRFVPVNDPHRFALIDGQAVLSGNLKQAVRESERSFPKLSTEELLTLLRSLG